MIACHPEINAGRQALRRGLIALVLVAAATLAPARTCPAGLVLSSQNVTTSAGLSGSFDLLITNTNAAGGASYLVASDVLQVNLMGTTGVQFTGVSISTTSTYLFPVSGTTQGGGPLSNSSFPGTAFIASDSDFETTSPFARTISAGQTFGLAHVSYKVSAGALPSMGMIDIIAGMSSLADASGSNVGFTVTNGTFAVTGASVPEPPTILMTVAGGVIAALGRRWTRMTRHNQGQSKKSGGL